MPLLCTVEPNGDLLITVDGDERDDLATQVERSYWGAFADLFEPYACNGSYTPFDAGDGDPFVGLTSAPCIAEALTVEDDGTRTIDGRLWWFPDYMVDDPLDDLIKTGRAVFRFAPDDPDA